MVEKSGENRYHAHLPFRVLSEEARLIHLPNTVVDKNPLSEGAPGDLGKQTHGAMRTGAQGPTHTAGEREGRNLLKVFIALSFVATLEVSSAQTVADVQGQNLQEQTELPGCGRLSG